MGGAIYDITTGQVEFIGGPPSVQAAVPALVRTAKSDYVPGPKALATLKAGNASYASGQAPAATQKSRIQALASDGQLPMAAVLGCADSRCPVELMFNVAPGDIFVCRNAGNAIAKAEGNIVASMEYCMAHLQTKLLVVLGHTKCGALNGALASIPAADAAPKADASALEQYLVALTPAAKQAKAELPSAPDKEVAELAIRINVKNTMRSIVQISEPLRKQWQSGDLLIEGAIHWRSRKNGNFRADRTAKFRNKSMLLVVLMPGWTAGTNSVESMITLQEFSMTRPQVKF